MKCTVSRTESMFAHCYILVVTVVLITINGAQETSKAITKERKVMDHGAGNMEGVIEKRQELTFRKGCKDAFPWSYKCNKPCLWWKNKGRCRHKWRKYKGCAPKASASIFVRDTCAVSCGKCKNGAWANWGSWNSCSTSCGAGVKTRKRSCTRPAPRGGGTYCRGPPTSTTKCNENACPETTNKEDVTSSTKPVTKPSKEPQATTIHGSPTHIPNNDGELEMKIETLEKKMEEMRATVSELQEQISALYDRIQMVPQEQYRGHEFEPDGDDESHNISDAEYQ